MSYRSHFIAGGLAALLVGPGFASETWFLDRDVARDDVEIEIEVERVLDGQGEEPMPVDPPEVLASNESIPVGDGVRVCFTASESGYVTVWSENDNGDYALILPNRFIADPDVEGMIRVRGGERRCIGDQEYYLLVGEPAGTTFAHVHWTAEPEDQLSPDDFITFERSRSATARAVPVFAASEFVLRVVKE